MGELYNMTENTMTDEEYEEIEILYNKKLAKVGERKDWRWEWEQQVNPNPEIWTQETATAYAEWEKTNLMSLEGRTMLFGDIVDVIPEQVFGKLHKSITCCVCKKPILPNETHHVTGLITYINTMEEDMDLYCEPRHVGCESEMC